MPTIIFIEPNGTEHSVTAEVGTRLMLAAVDNMVPAITGDCGGSCACGTCHGYVDEAWLNLFPLPMADELSMLDGVVDRQANSRLTCQLAIREDMDGMIIRLPVT